LTPIILFHGSKGPFHNQADEVLIINSILSCDILRKEVGALDGEIVEARELLVSLDNIDFLHQFFPLRASEMPC